MNNTENNKNLIEKDIREEISRLTKLNNETVSKMASASDDEYKSLATKSWIILKELKGLRESLREVEL